MDKFIITVLFLLFNHALIAQDAKTPQEEALSFTEVAQPPLSKKCKAKWEVQRQKECTSGYINDFVNNRYNYKLAEKWGVKGMVSLEATFVINESGLVENISVKGGMDKLNKHFLEIIEKLPEFKPAMHQGKSVPVSMTLPITIYIAP